MPAHPLDPLSAEETNLARDFVKEQHANELLSFREIFLEEPPKTELIAFLLHDSSNTKTQTARPDRRALCQYDVIGEDGIPRFHESIVNITTKKTDSHTMVDEKQHASLTLSEFDVLVEVCTKSQMFKDAIAEFELPEGFEVLVEPWPYGGLAPDEENRRYFEGLCFAQDKRSGNPDSNFYAFPLPIIPVMDAHKSEIIRIDRLPTGGVEDGLKNGQRAKNPIEQCRPAEYVPELLKNGPRTDLKQLNVLQPDGPSFTAKRALFAQHHVWVSKHHDGEFYAGGRYTLQSQNEIGGVADAVERGGRLDGDPVIWNVFGLTHNPRVEDWPVMPVEIHQLHIKPVDFFTANPAIDVPSGKNEASCAAKTKL